MIIKPKRVKGIIPINLDDSIYTQENSDSLPMLIEDENSNMPLFEPPLPLFEDNEIDDLIEEIGGIGNTTETNEQEFDEFWEDIGDESVASQVVDVVYEPNSYYQRQLDDDHGTNILRKSTRVRKPIVRFAN